MDDREVAVLGWVIPRPTGRWHQAIVVTDSHVWITPEITFTDNSAMVAAAQAGIEDFHKYVRSSGWIRQPQRCSIADVSGLNWNETTGWLRIAGADDDVIGAMIPDREAGSVLVPQVKAQIAKRRSVSPA